MNRILGDFHGMIHILGAASLGGKRIQCQSHRTIVHHRNLYCLQRNGRTGGNDEFDRLARFTLNGYPFQCVSQRADILTGDIGLRTTAVIDGNGDIVRTAFGISMRGGLHESRVAVTEVPHPVDHVPSGRGLEIDLERQPSPGRVGLNFDKHRNESDKTAAVTRNRKIIVADVVMQTGRFIEAVADQFRGIGERAVEHVHAA